MHLKRKMPGRCKFKKALKTLNMGGMNMIITPTKVMLPTLDKPLIIVIFKVKLTELDSGKRVIIHLRRATILIKTKVSSMIRLRNSRIEISRISRKGNQLAVTTVEGQMHTSRIIKAMLKARITTREIAMAVPKEAKVATKAKSKIEMTICQLLTMRQIG